MRCSLIVALVLSCSAGCAWSPVAQPEPTPAAPIDTLSLEYEVYAFLLDHWGVTGRSSIVLRGDTAAATESRPFDETERSLKQTLRDSSPPISLSKDLLDSYRESMDRNRSLDPSRLGVADLRMASSEEIDAWFGGPEDGWPAFRDRFGSQASLVTFSRVGFSSDGSRALLTLSRSCGPLCGTGSFVLLEKTDGRWRIVTRVRIWVA